jgi:hypothetical protein
LKSWLPLEWQLEDPVGDGQYSRIVAAHGVQVGHHGSHNATLKEGGLEVMTSPLVAIPVDRTSPTT